jgi:hypothetical protein
MSFAINERLKTQIAPHRVTSPLHGAGNAEGRMLVWDDVVLVFRVWRLVLWCHIDVLNW